MHSRLDKIHKRRCRKTLEYSLDQNYLYIGMKKILFLDIDGVMVPIGTGAKNNGLYDHDPFDKDCVSELNMIIEKTDCEIIISSTWRHFYEFEQIQEIFSWNGVQKIPSGLTPDYENKFGPDEEWEKIKCHEISGWLTDNDVNRELKWCATDDTDLSIGLQNFVRCLPEEGLKSKGVTPQIISYLKN